MMDVAMSLAEYEKEILRPWCEEKLEELREVAEGYCILEDLDEVIRSWLGEEGEDEDKDEDECDSEVETGIDVDTSGYR